MKFYQNNGGGRDTFISETGGGNFVNLLNIGQLQMLRCWGRFS